MAWGEMACGSTHELWNRQARSQNCDRRSIVVLVHRLKAGYKAAAGLISHPNVIPSAPSEPTALSMWATDSERSHVVLIRRGDSRTLS